MFVLPVFLTLLVICQCQTQLQESPRPFSIELMRRTAEETQWHTAISPLGVWSLLTSLYIGAAGSSKAQLLRTLNLPNVEGTVVSEYKQFINTVILPPTPDVQLKWNNFLFLDTGLTIEREFDETIRNDFDTKITRLDFKWSAEAADNANRIIQESDVNVPDVFQSDDFKSNARIILTNTISFKGLWQFPFNISDTQVKDFHDETGSVIGTVNMMVQQGSFSYSNIEPISAFVVELPYGETNQYSFLAILPYQGVKLADVLSGMQTFSLKDILNQMAVDTEQYDLANVVVQLPRFKISTNIVLNTPLQSMGLVDIFYDSKASFDHISKDIDDLYVSSIVHNANIEVTETGTVASAVTIAAISDRILPYYFIADRPFLYFIIEKSTSTIIFSGAYSIPMMY